jgi:hypothetical protein
MRWWLLVAIAARLDAQAPSSPATSPVPSTEPSVTGWLDVGYRWRTDVGGSFDTYRTIVNLGSGPKLLGSDFTITDPRHHFFDRIDVHAYNWGGEPYGNFQLRAKKTKLYEFNADYRDIAYFNFLPSFADPLLSRGYVLNQQSFDTRRRIGSLQLDMLPANWIVPYVAYEHNSGSGTGVATFVSDANQFPVPNILSDATNLYRGGVRFELRKFHATLEQGGTTFKDNQALYQNPGINYGDISAPVLGQTIILNNLLAAYGIRGSGIYTKVLVSATPSRRLDLYGQFLFSQPESDASYQQAAVGNLLQFNPLLFYTGQLFILSSAAKMPHTTGSAGAEIRPRRNVRVIQSWLTDRLHNAGSAGSNNQVFGPGVSQQTLAQLTAGLITNYNQVQTNVIWQVRPQVILRGGYRHEWGDASQAVLPPAGLASADSVELRRNVVIGGLTLKPTKKLTITGDAEGAPDDRAYFRTSLHNYQYARAQARYQIAAGISVAGDFNLLNNQNPAPDVRGDYLARQQSISVVWSPDDGKRFDVLGSYTRSTVRSNILFLQPQDFAPRDSIYRENGHTATALWNWKLPHTGGVTPKITAGGSLCVTSGSRPTKYYQPTATLWLPTGKHLTWFGEWHYYGFGEPFFTYEDFHAHTITAGVRISR